MSFFGTRDMEPFQGEQKFNLLNKIFKHRDEIIPICSFFDVYQKHFNNVLSIEDFFYYSALGQITIYVENKPNQEPKFFPVLYVQKYKCGDFIPENENRYNIMIFKDSFNNNLTLDENSLFLINEYGNNCDVDCCHWDSIYYSYYDYLEQINDQKTIELLGSITDHSVIDDPIYRTTLYNIRKYNPKYYHTTFKENWPDEYKEMEDIFLKIDPPIIFI